MDPLTCRVFLHILCMRVGQISKVGEGLNQKVWWPSNGRAVVLNWYVWLECCESGCNGHWCVPGLQHYDQICVCAIITKMGCVCEWAGAIWYALPISSLPVLSGFTLQFSILPPQLPHLSTHRLRHTVLEEYRGKERKRSLHSSSDTLS